MLRIKEILKEKGMTMNQLASLLGIHRVTLSQNLSRNPTLETLQKIANTLDVSVLDLFVDEREKDNTLNCPHCGKPIILEARKE